MNVGVVTLIYETVGVDNEDVACAIDDPQPHGCFSRGDHYESKRY